MGISGEPQCISGGVQVCCVGRVQVFHVSFSKRALLCDVCSLAHVLSPLSDLPASIIVVSGD